MNGFIISYLALRTADEIKKKTKTNITWRVNTEPCRSVHVETNTSNKIKASTLSA